jgi:aerotaxis receptor
MKNNQPVTQREYMLGDGVAIISKTDAKGLITWVNEDFIESSGFDEAELIGKAHNIVRHPDMPEEAFRDLWATIQSGRPWNGLVKNRRKDGDHYWVRASVTPQDDGGYMSVRQRPTRAEVQAAEALYQTMRTGRSRLHLNNGQLVKFGVLNTIGHWMNSLSVRSRIFTTAILGSIVLAGISIEAINSASQGQVNWINQTILVALGSVFFLLMATWLARSVLVPLKQVTEAAHEMARGNLACALPSGTHNELGNLVTEMTRTRDNLFEMVYSIRLHAQVVSTTANQLNQSAVTTEHASHEQSSAAANMAATIEQMSVSIDQVGEHANNAQRIANESGETSRQGGEIVHQAAAEMQHISEAVSNSASAIKELEGYSTEISSIVGVIKEVADQTNLLALNAAIEAARAGEQGRGFAVVADEVRKLAERTGQSTQQISEMIDRIQNGAERATEEMQASVERVTRGVQSAHAAGDSITRIKDGSSRVGQSIDDIALALKEQGVAMQEIARNVESIAQMSDANSTTASNTTALARRLATMAETLRGDVGRFRV